MFRVEAPLMIEQKRHAVDPNNGASQCAKASRMEHELAIAHSDDRTSADPWDLFDVVRRHLVSDTPQSIDPRTPALINSPSGDEMHFDPKSPPEFDGVPSFRIRSTHLTGVAH